MDLQLSGKKAIVTGSTAGIGFAAAEVLAREGTTVVINGRSRERVADALERIQNRLPGGCAVDGVAADLSTREGAEKIIQQHPDADILVNNLGIFEPKPFEEITDDDWLRFFQINVMSGVRLTRHYIEGMKARNWGRVVFVSSESGIHIPPEMIHYGMTKAANLAISRGVAETTAGTGVTVNAVLPGPTWSEGVSTLVEKMAAENDLSNQEMEREFFNTSRPTSILKRFTEPSEVAQMIAYVCSPLSSATNGAPLRADGGTVRAMA